MPPWLRISKYKSIRPGEVRQFPGLPLSMGHTVYFQLYSNYVRDQ